MRIPESLESLVDCGIIEEVVRPLMSGKEAHVYLVVAGGQERVAKVYKDSENRTFKHRSAYTEGRKVRNSRDQRAMESRSRHGRARDEAAWKNTEVDIIYRLRDAGVRVPAPYNFIDGVLVMELVTDADGHPAPRLGDLGFEPEQAGQIFTRLLAEVVRMLCAGIVHGDLSEYNVLVGADGPVVIDFPQAVDASSNQNAQKILVRDVDNLHRFAARHTPGYVALPYAQEMWSLYERGQLTPDTKLTGRHRRTERPADTRAVMSLIGDAAHDERRRRQGLGISLRGTEAAPSAAPAPRVDVRKPDVRRPDVRKPDVRRPEAARVNPAARADRPGFARQAEHPATPREPRHEAARGQHVRDEPARNEHARDAHLRTERTPHARQEPRPAERTPHARQEPRPAERTPHARQEPRPAERTPHTRQEPRPAERTPHARQEPRPAERTPHARQEVRHETKANGSRWGTHARHDAPRQERPAAAVGHRSERSAGSRDGQEAPQRAARQAEPQASAGQQVRPRTADSRGEQAPRDGRDRRR